MKALNQNSKTDIRQCGLNMNRWWPVAQIDSMPKSNLYGTRIGNLELLVVKQSNGHYAVFEDACPHKRVRLSTMGHVKNDQIQCQYHDWKFTSNTGECKSLDAMPGQENRFNLKPFPSQVYADWVWAFPGDPALADQTALPHIPPANSVEGYYRIPMEGTVNCHYSFITENATDLFHAELHQAQQPWANPRLVSLEESDAKYWHVTRLIRRIHSHGFLPAIKKKNSSSSATTIPIFTFTRKAADSIFSSPISQRKPIKHPFFRPSIFHTSCHGQLSQSF